LAESFAGGGELEHPTYSRIATGSFADTRQSETSGERSAKVNLEHWMSEQTHQFPEAEQTPHPVTAGAESTPPSASGRRTAPVWLQRLSLFVLVLFCVYLGVLVMVLPWWPRVWEHNLFIQARPWLASFLHRGEVRGIISGLGLIDIWIGISEAIHYRDYKD